jgi:limonene-1,2-epoxide hydrolase
LADPVVERFWAAMQRNDCAAAAEVFVPDIAIDWPCSGERIIGRANFVALQERYPTTTGRWVFDLHRLVSDRRTTVSEVTVSDGVQSARVITFSEVADGRIIRHVEYWPTAYEPPADRADLVERIPPFP